MRWLIRRTGNLLTCARIQLFDILGVGPLRLRVCVIAVFLASACSATVSNGSSTEPNKPGQGKRGEVFYEVGTLAHLVTGGYEGYWSFAEIKPHGNFGLDT